MTSIGALTQAVDALLLTVTAAGDPLHPGNGGRLVTPDALRAGDLLVATTAQPLSAAIRASAGADVSHVVLYLGDQRVAEPVGAGLIERALDETLADARIAVALRHPHLTHEQAQSFRDIVGRRIGLKYDGWRLVSQPLFQLDRQAFCEPLAPGSDARRACLRWAGGVRLSVDDPQRFFCSECVIATFEDVGAPLTAAPPHWTSPGDLSALGFSVPLAYLGHLKDMH
jgi:hypothetical protein